MTADSKIFISYRKSDAPDAASALFERLRGHFGTKCVFMDEDLHAGQRFPERLEDEIRRTDTMVVVVGPRWHSTIDDETGAPRLENPDDWVRREIELAKVHNCRIFPVMVGGADVPRASRLPPSVAWVFDFQAQWIERWSRDIPALIDRLERPSRDLFASWTRIQRLGVPNVTLVANALLKPCNIALVAILVALGVWRSSTAIAVVGAVAYVALSAISFFSLAEVRWVASREPSDMTSDPSPPERRHVDAE